MSKINDNKIDLLDFISNDDRDNSGATGDVHLDTKTLLEWIQKTHDKVLASDELLEKYKIDIENIKKDYDKQSQDIKDVKNDINEQRNRIPEIVGVFSAIIALVLIDVSIIKSFDSFLSAILLIAALTCSMVVFASLVHSFFSVSNRADKIKFGKTFWISNGILALLVVIGVILYIFNIDISKLKSTSVLIQATPTLQKND